MELLKKEIFSTVRLSNLLTPSSPSQDENLKKKEAARAKALRENLIKRKKQLKNKK